MTVREAHYLLERLEEEERLAAFSNEQLVSELVSSGSVGDLFVTEICSRLLRGREVD